MATGLTTTPDRSRGVAFDFPTVDDGDVLFTLSTETVPVGAVSELAVGEAASNLMWDAVLNAVNAT